MVSERLQNLKQRIRKRRAERETKQKAKRNKKQRDRARREQRIKNREPEGLREEATVAKREAVELANEAKNFGATFIPTSGIRRAGETVGKGKELTQQSASAINQLGDSVDTVLGIDEDGNDEIGVMELEFGVDADDDGRVCDDEYVPAEGLENLLVTPEENAKTNEDSDGSPIDDLLI